MFETILIIDNDAENTRSMIETLEARDYLVFTCPNKDAALAMARKVRPRLIFINPAMTEGGGLELCSTIHEEEEFKGVPIIVLFTFEGATDPRYTSLDGIVGSLKTPFVPEELISKTEDLLSKHPVEAQSIGSEVGGTVEREGIEIIEPHYKDTGKADLPPDEFAREEEPKTEHAGRRDEEPAAYDETTGGGKITEERLSAYAMKTSMRRRGTKNALLMPVIGVAAVMILIVAAILFYEKDSLPDKKAQPPAATKPLQSSQEQRVNAGPAQVPQKPEQPAEQSVAASMPKTDIPSPTPGAEPRTAAAKPIAKATMPKPEPKVATTKPSAKGMYSAQMGAFKREKHADALAAKYKEKGYEAFVYKTGTNDTEPFYRVLIGKFNDKKEALKMVKSISAKEGVQAILFRD